MLKKCKKSQLIKAALFTLLLTVLLELYLFDSFTLRRDGFTTTNKMSNSMSDMMNMTGGHHHHHGHNMMKMNMTSSTTEATMGAGGHNMGGGHHTGHESSSMMMMMPMTFYFGIDKVAVLFDCWTIDSVLGMVMSCLGIFVLSMLYEGLKVYRQVLLRDELKNNYRQYESTANNGTVVVETKNDRRGRVIWSRGHAIQSLLHLIQITISYALMLIFMTYNAYLGIAILLGSTLGYFVFGWKRAVIVDLNEHCH